MNQNFRRAGVRLVADSIMIFCSRSYLHRIMYHILLV